MIKRILPSTVFILLYLVSPVAAGSDLPRLHRQQIEFIGAFRLPASTFGSSSLNYAQGPIEYNSANHSLFIVGHAHHQSIAEFSIPPLGKGPEVGDLPMASPPLQVFTPVLDRPASGNPQSVDRVGGMEFIAGGASGGQLIINGYEYYDAPGDNSHTTIVARESNDLQNCRVDGYSSFAGGAGHTSGWLSPIPPEWQKELAGSHITGQSSGIPIISRTSVGPSAFAFQQEVFLANSSLPEFIETTRLLDFSLAHPLHPDLDNDSRNNDVWTHLSRVVFGLIVPGTRTYLTIGHSGGHQSGVCYKCTQNDGNLCGGYCANDAEDYSNYIWLWDIEDLLLVKEGKIASHDVRPYGYGAFNIPFGLGKIGGGSYDSSSGTLYLSVLKADRLQGTYANPPLIVAFTFDVTRSSNNTLPPASLLLLEND